MTFTILTVVAEDSPAHPFVPVPGDSPDTVELEPSDGNYIVAAANYLTVRTTEPSRSSPNSRIMRVPDIKATVLITDQRVAVACSKFDKGSTWTPLGGLASGAIALTGTAISKSRATKRRRGRMLVGQIRYPWLVNVGFTEKTGFGSQELLRLGIVNPDPNEANGLILDIDLSRGQSAREIARDIVRRAARYRLDNDSSMPSEEQRLTEALLDPPQLERIKNKFASYFFVEAPPRMVDAYQSF
jgi:hypothetical protein